MLPWKPMIKKTQFNILRFYTINVYLFKFIFMNMFKLYMQDIKKMTRIVVVKKKEKNSNSIKRKNF